MISLPGCELASNKGGVVLGGDGDAGGRRHVHLRGALRHLPVDLGRHREELGRGVDRHSD